MPLKAGKAMVELSEITLIYIYVEIRLQRNDTF